MSKEDRIEYDAAVQAHYDWEEKGRRVHFITWAAISLLGLGPIIVSIAPILRSNRIGDKLNCLATLLLLLAIVEYAILPFAIFIGWQFRHG